MTVPSQHAQVQAAQDWLAVLAERAPRLLECIDPARLDEGRRVVREITAGAPDFDSELRGGRGESYRHAQTSMLVRSRGILGLFDLLSPDGDFRRLPADARILDVLGGDGLLARVMARIGGPRFADCILTSDVSQDMVQAAAESGLVPICQAAQFLVLRDECLDGVLFAYGTHHIPPADRVRVCREAHRVLKQGGKVLLHDFEESSPVARWFSRVVESYSSTGHAFPHFSVIEIQEYLSTAGFTDVRVEHFYDPFVLTAGTGDAAREALASYLLHMYGLQVLVEEIGIEQALHKIYALADYYFRYDYEGMGLAPVFGSPRITLREIGGRVEIELPRVAVVGIGTK